MANNKRTVVSKAGAAIKGILGAAFPSAETLDFGRRVTVVEVDETWTHTEYCDDFTKARVVDLATLQAGTPMRPTYTSPVTHHAPSPGMALVIGYAKYRGGGVEIVVRRVLDDSGMDPIIDAALSKQGQKRIEAAARASLEYAGVSGTLWHTGVVAAVACGKAKDRERQAEAACEAVAS